MRKDMAKVIVERERVGPHYGKTKDPYEFRFVANQGWEEEDEDDYYNHPMSLKKPHKVAGNYKMLNENLSPLKRFIASRVGQSWDKVHSEICENISPDSATQIHILQHLKDYVKTEKSPPKSWFRNFYSFYVDEHGILRKTERKVSRYINPRKPKPSETIILAYELEKPTHPTFPLYANLGGIWFRISWDEAPFRDWDYACKHDWKCREFNKIYANNDINIKFPEGSKMEPQKITDYKGHEVTVMYKKFYTLYPRFIGIDSKELKNLKLFLASRVIKEG